MKTLCFNEHDNFEIICFEIQSTFYQFIIYSNYRKFWSHKLFFCNKDLFLSYTLVDDQTIFETKSDQRINAEQKEIVCLLLKNENDQKTKLILIDVLYVLKLNCNLMSIFVLQRKNSKFFFEQINFQKFIAKIWSLI